MNCYDFELNITQFIEGELKQKDLMTFKSHRESCSGCKLKLNDMKKIIRNLNNLNPLSAPNDFTIKLHKKLNLLDNRSLSKKWNIMELLPFGMRPINATAFGFSLIVVIVSSFMLINVDKVPAINMAKHEQNISPNQFNEMPINQANNRLFTQSTRKDSNKIDSLNNQLKQHLPNTPPIKHVKKTK